MSRRRLPCACASVALALASLTPTRASAELYTFTDENGVIHFTNIPNDPRYRVVPDPGSNNTYQWQEDASAPPRRIHRVDITRFDELIVEAARYYSLPPALVKAVIATESAFEPNAVSHAGAQGLMQLIPGTARDMYVQNVFDPKDNIYGGTRYLRYLANLFDGDVRLTVAAYNCGPHVVSRTKNIPGIPETQMYVKRVMALYQHYLTTWMR